MAELDRTMTARELYGWLAYLSIESEEQQKAADNAKKKQGSGGISKVPKKPGGVRLGNRRKVPKPE